MIRAANAAAFGWVTRTDSAKDAIVRIGLSEARRVVVGATMGLTFNDLEQSGIDVAQMWRHVVASALLADATAWGAGSRSGGLHRRDAARHRPPGAGDRRPGALPPRGGVGARRHRRSSGGDAALGVDHVDWGLQVGEAFRFPQEIVEAIAHHHEGGDDALSWLIANGRRLAWSLGIGDGLVAPDEPSFDLQSDDGAVLEAIGGVESFELQVESYREAFTGQA